MNFYCFLNVPSKISCGCRRGGGGRCHGALAFAGPQQVAAGGVKAHRLGVGCQHVGHLGVDAAVGLLHGEGGRERHTRKTGRVERQIGKVHARRVGRVGCGAVVRDQHIAVVARVVVDARQAAHHRAAKLGAARKHLLANQPQRRDGSLGCRFRAAATPRGTNLTHRQ